MEESSQEVQTGLDSLELTQTELDYLDTLSKSKIKWKLKHASGRQALILRRYLQMINEEHEQYDWTCPDCGECGVDYNTMDNMCPICFEQHLTYKRKRR